MRLMRLTVTAGLGILVLSGCSDGDTKEQATDDIRVTTCAADPAGGNPKTAGTIANSTSKPSAYTFRVRFLDPSGNEVSAANVAVAKVEAGITTDWNSTGLTSAKGTLSCQVANVERTAVGT